MSSYLDIPFYDEIVEFQARQQDLGFTFPLSATSIGRDEVIKAHASRLNLMDRAAVERLPIDAQQAVWDGLKAVRDERKKLERTGENDIEPESIIDAVIRNERVLPAADAYCLAAFRAPRLAKNERERLALQEKNPAIPVWTIDRVHPEDRISFFLACSDADSEQAKLLKMFRPSGAIEAQGTVTATNPTPADAQPYESGETPEPAFRSIGAPISGV